MFRKKEESKNNIQPAPLTRGTLIVVSAPSGCGKDTLLAEVVKSGNYYYSISATTRCPREGEINGKHYYFMTQDEFQRRINEEDMLEYAEYCGNLYGTPRREVEKKLSEGYDVILKIETDGAMQVKKLFPEALFIFIVPPSMAVLRERLEKRGTETASQIELRIAQARNELEFSSKYNSVIVNDSLEVAVEDFHKTVQKFKEEYINGKTANLE